MIKKGLSYDDVLLAPQYSEIESRADINIGIDMGHDLELSLPILASPMDTVSESSMAIAMQKAGGAAVIHRYNTIEEQARQISIAKTMCSDKYGYRVNIGAAIGVSGDYLERAQALRAQHVAFVCIDVAHGHHILMKKALHELRKVVGENLHIMAGNIATLAGINDLSDWGADSVRCNIGGGSICSTRVKTGHGIPGLQTILDCAKTDRNVKIIADGGIRTSGDIVKALAAGADAVMCGSLLAGTDEAPGDVYQDLDGSRWKSYRGMASKEAQLKWRGRYNSQEGVATRIPYRGPIEDILRDIEAGVRSGFSYSGAIDMKSLHSRAQFMLQTQSGLSESHTHIVGRKW
jgi:IMP dehydrogenase|tara:strand:- start:8990 stop:10033 length:1044 start_codon:yes stop_codon:yes gene_type:complete